MSADEAFQEESPLLDVEKKPEAKKKPLERRNKKRASSKDFTSDLDTLFQMALSETIEEKEKKKKSVPKSSHRPRRSRRLSGLDALIRRTEDLDVVEVNVPTKKRVSFVCDKEKVAKLKQIAKKEKAYLKDIIGEVVSKFIEKYEKEQQLLS